MSQNSISLHSCTNRAIIAANTSREIYMKIFKSIGKLLAIVVAAAVALVIVAYFLCLGSNGAYLNEDGSYREVTAKHSFNHIMEHPGLEGLGEEILPLGNDLLRKICGPWKLKIMIPFLGKHEETVVDGLNYAIASAENGNSQFISYYDEAAKAADPAKEDTGLLYYKTAEGAPFFVVAPGGGFTMLGVASSAYPYAKQLQEAGYNVFVLEYRVGVYEGEEDKLPAAADRAVEDMEAAVACLIENAEVLGVSSKDYIVLGSSAGGQVTARYCAEQKYTSMGLPAPAACIMLYPVNCQRYDYTGCTVPMYITVCEDDPQIDVNGLDTAVEAMNAAGLTVSYNKFETGGHSFGIGVGTPAEGWMERALLFVEPYLSD